MVCGKTLDGEEAKTLVKSTPAPAPMSAPSRSISVAISGAERLSVPWVSSEAVKLATPALPAGSSDVPALKLSRAEINGRPGLRATSTRIPLASRRSATCGVAASTAAPGCGKGVRWPSGSRVTGSPAAARVARVIGAVNTSCTAEAGFSASACR